MKNHTRVGSHDRRRGGALIIALIAVIFMTALSSAILRVTTAEKKVSVSSTSEMKAFYAAEAGANAALASLRIGLTADPVATRRGTYSLPTVPGKTAPASFGGGTYWSNITDNGDGTFTLASTGSFGNSRQGVEMIAAFDPGGVYANAVFAGNSSGDATYSLDFSGTGSQGDDIIGDIYSGADINIQDDASIGGTMRATGTIMGGPGDEGVSQSIPDIAAMNYEVNHDFDVAALFGSATYQSSAMGGDAWQLPESSPAHIFRKNPARRAADTSGTAKDDYFLEDPYETMNRSSDTDARQATRITLSGIGGHPGVNGNDKVYFIDGNLWIHNGSAYSFMLHTSGGEAQRVVFVVKGNIYFSDNLLYQDENTDAVAFISIKDENVPDTGNIYFGDPSFGTLEHMDAFMYAENDFYDTNLSASGSATVTVNGNMTAGNQVKINRDFSGQHSKLTVEFDDRLWTGEVTLPMLPTDAGAGASLVVASWRRIATP